MEFHVTRVGNPATFCEGRLGAPTRGGKHRIFVHAVAEERVAGEEKKLEALDREGVQKARNEAEKRRGDLGRLRERIHGIAKMEA
ncbi:hypothetical protein IKQ19_09850, partial [Candidatus Saccharibacteria bacterium]|nr:hypothetical protein [Candidatus Saccharibacteria bacterium]